MRVIDLTNQTFGKLTVLRGENLSNGGKDKPLKGWVCRCDCGAEVTIRGRDLRTGNTQSCGCSNSHELLIGKRYHKLTVVGLGEPLLYSRSGKPRGVKRWKCLCDCGGVKDVAPYQLFNGAVKSCGCEWHAIRLQGDEASFRQLVHQYTSNARQRHKVFRLTNEEIRQLTSGDCHYCGAPPAIKYRARNRKSAAQPYIFNGIDRVNNDIGYLLDNCVSCCKICNYMKRSMSREAFLAHINKIATRSVLR